MIVVAILLITIAFLFLFYVGWIVLHPKNELDLAEYEDEINSTLDLEAARKSLEMIDKSR